MDSKDFLQNLNKLGFPLFEVSDDFQVNETISELVKTDDLRLLEGFPVVLANASKNNTLDINKVKKILTNKKDYEAFYTLFLISISLYKFLHLSGSWVNHLFDNLRDEDRSIVGVYQQNFNNGSDIHFHGKSINTVRFMNTFNDYFNQSFLKANNNYDDIRKIKNNYEELSLEYAMSFIFTQRQKEIFLKRAYGKKMTKTEREYFYRVIKKKAIALANSDLHLLARKTVE